MKKISKILIVIIILVLLLLVTIYLYPKNKNNSKNNYITLSNLTGLTLNEANNYAKANNINLNILYEYNLDINKDIVISQDIPAGTNLNELDKLNITVSKGTIPDEIYQENNVNELGNVPIMMYHGIVNITNSETNYIGGNVDKDGYNRTTESFRNDLEFYYQKGYRMIKLNDYINGKIDVELGKSPIILTFDDGNPNNFNVLGEENGQLIIDPNCAVGILEEFKAKYPDYNVTATFFVNSALFSQEKYNEKILKWLITNGYDIGNHTMTHCDFTKITKEQTIKEVGGLYQLLEKIIPNDYVPIIALPFGSPYQKNNTNYASILNGTYQDFTYETKGALRVGWESSPSCFSSDFDPTYLKRIRAYDNNGVEFDIEMNFKILEQTKYISDGNTNTIVIPSTNESYLNNQFDNLKIITY